MATYKQNSKNDIGTTEQVTRLFLDDINLFGKTANSLYLQDEAIIIKMLLASYHMDNPDMTVGNYLEGVHNKQFPSIIAITRAIYRAIENNLLSYKSQRKENLKKIQIVRPEKEKIESLVDLYCNDLNRTDMIVQYYIDNYAITKNTRVVDWLDLAASPDIASLSFIDLFIMRKLDKDKQSKVNGQE